MRKIAMLLAVLMLAMCALAGCGGGSSASTAPATPAAPADTAAPAAPADSAAPAGGTLVMGTNAAFPPYEFTGENGKIEGIDPEIAQAIADKLGMTLEIKDMAFDSLIPAVSGGSIDIVFAGMTVTDERLQSVNYTDSYATGIQVIIVPEGSDIQTVDNLDGKTIGVQSGTTGDIYCTDDYGQENVKQYDNGAMAVAALLNGQVDCVIIDNEPAKAFVAANTGLIILDTEYVVEDYAAAIAKDNTALLEQVNGAMAELKADGTIDAIVEKYIPTK